MKSEELIREILTLYPTESVGAMQNSFPVASGLIHRTFKVETDRGTFCLQRLHPKLAGEEIIEDYREVLSFLATKGFPAPRLIFSKGGKAAVEGPDGGIWRLTTWLPGKTLERAEKPEHFYSAAELLGKFHLALLDFEYQFRSKHPLHDTAFHLRNLKRALENRTDSEWWPKVSPLADQLLEEIQDYFLPDDLPKRVVHGDPKISNFLFGSNERAAALIDLDTCNRHFTLVDLGDAIRSWCSVCEGENCYLSEERFKLFVDGYLNSGFPITEREIRYIPTAVGLITLELAARFLTDTLEDSYFGWDPKRFPSRPHHNFFRAVQMINLGKNAKRVMNGE